MSFLTRNKNRTEQPTSLFQIARLLTFQTFPFEVAICDVKLEVPNWNLKRGLFPHPCVQSTLYTSGS